MRRPSTVFLVLLSFGAAANAQEEMTVAIKGTLAIYDDYKEICREARKRAVVLADVRASDKLNLAAQTRAIDRNCFWSLNGILRDSATAKVTVTIHAIYLDYVIYPKPPEISIYQDDANATTILRTGVQLVLYSSKRAGDELRAIGHSFARRAQTAPSDVDQVLVNKAVAKYDEAVRYYRDPQSLYAKADLLEQAGRYSESASAWKDLVALGQTHQGQAYSSIQRTKDAPWRLVSVLRKDLDTSSPSKWGDLAQTANEVLSQSAPVSRRERILANWLDALFIGSESRGDYSKLAIAISDDPEIRNSWAALYQQYKGSAPANSSPQDVAKQIDELSKSLGRK